MSKNFSAKIKLYYPMYNSLIEKDKIIYEKEIILIPKQGNHWHERQVSLQHDSDDKIEFCASKKDGDPKYGLKIFIKNFNEEPVYYFDSDGPAHFTTSDSNIRLSRVDTPHINYYDENGRKQAIQTKYIRENIEKLTDNINFGMAYFCSETNINKNLQIPLIGHYEQTEIISKKGYDSFDIHADIKFPHGE